MQQVHMLSLFVLFAESSPAPSPLPRREPNNNAASGWIDGQADELGVTHECNIRQIEFSSIKNWDSFGETVSTSGEPMLVTNVPRVGVANRLTRRNLLENYHDVKGAESLIP